MTVNPLTTLRLRDGRSVRELATAASISPSTLRRMEHGERPTQRTLRRVARALGVDLAVEFTALVDEEP